METIPQLSQTDHDLLIRMSTKSELGIADLKTDIAQVNTSIAELKGSFTSMFTSLESRVKIMENMSASVDVLGSMKKLEKHEAFINDYVSTHKERNGIWAWWLSIISIIIAAIAAIGNFSKLAFR